MNSYFIFCCKNLDFIYFFFCYIILPMVWRATGGVACRCICSNYREACASDTLRALIFDPNGPCVTCLCTDKGRLGSRNRVTHNQTYASSLVGERLVRRAPFFSVEAVAWGNQCASCIYGYTSSAWL